MGAAVGTLAALVVGLWAYVTEPWYDGEVIRQLRSCTYNAPWRDETPRLAALFPEGMAMDSARSLLGASGFSCTQSQAEAGKGIQLTRVRKAHGSVCNGTYTVDLTIDRDQGVTGRSGNSYIACL
jgi:hypothetical protein